jgi:hypothetical protein
MLYLLKGVEDTLKEVFMVENNKKIIKEVDLKSEKPGLVKDFEKKKKGGPKLIFLVLILVLAGVGTGYGLSLVAQKSGGGVSRDVAAEDIKKGTTVGVTDKKTFRDSTEGDLKKGGIDGEGSHHLERPGGPSQNVYLTSSIVDLDKFVGKKVKVWGETFAAQKAGWLMDVGKLEVLD